MENRKAFTIIELMFIVVIIGILTAIVVPKLEENAKDKVVQKQSVEERQNNTRENW